MQRKADEFRWLAEEWAAGLASSIELMQPLTFTRPAMGGVVVGFFQWLALKDVSVRWIGIAALAGVGVGAAHAVYPPLTIVAAPAAGAIAGLFQAPWNPRWPRAQALAAAWAALGAMLPFPRWAAAAFMVGAAVISAWGIAGSPRFPLRRGVS